jgi:ketosteroid isomerase-like protein
MQSLTTPAMAPELVVSAWVEAFNAWNLDGLLAHLHPDIEFHPLRLAGTVGAYRGHAGVCEWFARLDRGGLAQRIDLSAVQVADDGRVLAVGTLCLADETAIAPFGSIYRFADGLVVDARQYFSSQVLLQRLGLFP